MAEMQSLLPFEPESKPVITTTTIETPGLKDTDSFVSERSTKHATPNWKPWPIHPLYLSSLIAIHVVQLAVLLFLLQQASPLVSTPEYKILTNYNGTLIANTTVIALKPSIFIFSHYNSSAYFGWQFVPIIIAVVMGTLWGTVDAAVRQLEPYYQLSRPEGALGRDTLCQDYLSAWIYLLPFQAVRRQQWGVALSSIIHLLVLSVIPTVHSSIIKIVWPGVRSAIGGRGRIGLVTVNKGMLLAAVSLHGVVAVVAIMLVVVMVRRRTGLVSEPGGLAGLAALTSDSFEVRRLMERLPPCATQKTIDQLLGDRRFWLKHVVVSSSGRASQTAYQVVTTPETGKDDQIVLRNPEKQSRREAQPVSLWGRTMFAVDALLIGPYIAILVAILTDRTWPVTTIKALYTLSTTIVTSFLQMLDRDLRLTQPYYVLSQSKDRFSYTRTRQAFLQDYSYLTPFATIATAIRTGAPLIALNVFAGLLSQIFTIIFPTVMEGIWEIYLINVQEGDFYVYSTSAQSLAILKAFLFPPALTKWCDAGKWFSYFLQAVMFINGILIITKRRKAIMPRKPSTMASSLAYLANSERALALVRGTSLIGSREREQRVKDILGESTFGFGWFTDGYGRWRLGVEREPIKEKYVFGKMSPESSA
ncbi:hypothetical protein BDQ12DRAFT_355224 [Crucibulum laeve]|uniref:Uncharacterized protein n=1 Tax=Crucibulum laeve TaxID=68775 RepID=A0A5C3MBA2_9AGAR|nr:hypothetical protein BDQ12DRAFT_355224 [Crucibulum laeve]